MKFDTEEKIRIFMEGILFNTDTTLRCTQTSKDFLTVAKQILTLYIEAKDKDSKVCELSKLTPKCNPDWVIDSVNDIKKGDSSSNYILLTNYIDFRPAISILLVNGKTAYMAVEGLGVHCMQDKHFYRVAFCRDEPKYKPSIGLYGVETPSKKFMLEGCICKANSKIFPEKIYFSKIPPLLRAYICNEVRQIEISADFYEQKPVELFTYELELPSREDGTFKSTTIESALSLHELVKIKSNEKTKIFGSIE